MLTFFMNWVFASSLATIAMVLCSAIYVILFGAGFSLHSGLISLPRISRQERRARVRWKMRQRKARFRYRSYHRRVHRSFPLRLRNLRFDPGKCPTIDEQAQSQAAHEASARAQHTNRVHQDRQRQEHANKMRYHARRMMANHKIANCPKFTFRNPHLRKFETETATSAPSYCDDFVSFSATTVPSKTVDCLDCFDVHGNWRNIFSRLRPSNVLRYGSRFSKRVRLLLNPLHLCRVGIRQARRLYAFTATRSDNTLKDSFHVLYGYLSEKNDDGVEVIYDTGASTHVLNDIRLFDEPPKPLACAKELGGIGSGVPIIGVGTFTLRALGVDGKPSYFRGTAYYAPACRKSLVSVQMLAQHAKYFYQGSDWLEGLASSDIEPSCHVNHERLVLSNLAPNMSDIYVPLDSVSNLPIGLVYPASDQRDEFFPQAHLCAVDHSNRNLSAFQKELLRWHARLGHPSMADVYSLLRHRVIRPSKAGVKVPTEEADLPKCSSCAYGNLCRRPKPGYKTTMDPSVTKASVSDRLFPGQRVFTDHFYSSTPGRLESGYGKSGKTYCGGTIWVDGATGFTKVYMQPSMDTHSTLLSKKKFEREMADHNVPFIHEYVCDGAKSYTLKEFDLELRDLKQVQRLAAPGAHHHNGIAERAIGVTMSFARTQLIHAAMRWPEVTDVGLWPMSVTHSAYLHNILPKSSRGNLAPMQLLLNAQLNPKRFDDLHVWGSPVFVLEPALRDGKKLPRWRPRSRRGVYLGVSQRYAASAPLCLNLTTGSITPQFHCLFD